MCQPPGFCVGASRLARRRPREQFKPMRPARPAAGAEETELPAPAVERRINAVQESIPAFHEPSGPSQWPLQTNLLRACCELLHTRIPHRSSHCGQRPPPSAVRRLLGKDNSMDLRDGPLCPLHRLHSVSHCIMEEEPLKNSGALFPHV